MKNQLHVYAHEIMWNAEAVDTLTNMINASREKNIILNFTWEGLPVQRWIKNYLRLIEAIDQHKRIFVVVNDCYSSADIDKFKISKITDILVVDFFVYYAFHHFKHWNQTSWNDEAKSFLYLNGKDKPKRFWLLHAMTKNPQLMAASIYSYHPALEYEVFVKDSGISSMGGISEIDYKEFQHTWARNLDDRDYRPTCCSKFDSEWLRNSAFSLVIETNFNSQSPPWLTEKTYLPIINHRPFLIAGDVGTLAALRRKGYETFEDILPEKNYDQIRDLDHKIDALIINTEYLLNNALRHNEYIHMAVKHNHVVMLEQVNAVDTQLKNFAVKHGLDLDVDNLLPTGPHWIDENWRIFYQNLKDDSWPSCELLHQLDILPKKIQQECIHDLWFDAWFPDYAPAYQRLPKAWLTKYDNTARLDNQLE